MARTKTETYIAYGGIELVKDKSYTSDNLPAEANIIRLMRGVRIKDSDGSDTPLRGVRIKITTSGLTPAVTPLPNIPTIWYEGEVAIISLDSVIEVYDNGIITYGKLVTE